jgi:hypothetical protein
MRDFSSPMLIKKKNSADFPQSNGKDFPFYGRIYCDNNSYTAVVDNNGVLTSKIIKKIFVFD